MKNRLIINSFLRRKVFILYIILLVVTYSGLLVLSVLLSNLQETKKNNYLQNSLATIHQKNDIYGDLKKNKMLADVKRVVYFDDIEDEMGIYDILKEPRVNSKILVIEDSSLNDSQIDLYLNEDSYEEITKMSHYSGCLTFVIKNNTYTFSINKVRSNKHINNISVSSKVFREIMKLNDEFDYIFKLYNTEDEVKEKLKEVKVLTGTTEDQALIANRINQYIEILIIFNIIIGITFIIIIFVIANTIIHDLKKNITLEILLGFNKKEISKNIIIRLSTLNILSLIMSFFVSLLILLIINLFYSINIWLYNYYLFLIIFVIIIIDMYYVIYKSVEGVR